MCTLPWKAANGPVIGFVGHRDLTGFASVDDLTGQLSQTFMALAAERRAETLVSGYAPGADQIAVAAWNALGLPQPRLVFPYAEPMDGGAKRYHTDDPAAATAMGVFEAKDLALIGKPALPDQGDGHAAQAATLLARADILVAVVDESRPELEGGTTETVNRARKMGKEVIVIGPGGAGGAGS